MTTTTFDIAGRIRDLLTTSDQPDPVKLAAQLLDGLTVAERAEAFAQVAPMVVNVFATRGRQRTARPPAADQHGGTPVRTRSDRLRDWWRTELRKRYVGADGWKLLGEFTEADFVHAIAERVDRADALMAKADWLQRCHDALKVSRATRFDKLPPATLAALFTAQEGADT